MGLPNLRAGDQQKVEEGNMFMRFSASVLKLALLLHVAFTLENPGGSRLWLCAPLQCLQRRKHVSLVFFEMCVFGTPRRKPTSVLGIHLDLSPLSTHRCLGAKQGFCRFSGKPHLLLCGLDQSGSWRTKQAQTYPRPMCKVLARCFADFEVATVAANFEKRLRPESSAVMGG